MTRYKFHVGGKCKSRPKIALKTSFNAQKPFQTLKSTSEQKNFVSNVQNAFRGNFFCPFYKFHAGGKCKSYFQISPDFCTPRKNRIITRYKIHVGGKCKSRPKIDRKTSFNAQNHFQTSKSSRAGIFLLV